MSVQPQAFEPSKTKDKIFIVMLILAALSGMALSLASAGYLLAFNVQTLLISTVIFAITGASYILKAKPVTEQLKYASLAVVPIALRAILNMPFFKQYASLLDPVSQLIFALQVIALWIIVAVCEEAFRASMMTFSGLFIKHRNSHVALFLRILFANVLWILFHFIQRPFDPFLFRYYIVWLFCTGMLLGFVLHKAGLGAATLIHFIVNLTA